MTQELRPQLMLSVALEASRKSFEQQLSPEEQLSLVLEIAQKRGLNDAEINVAYVYMDLFVRKKVTPASALVRSNEALQGEAMPSNDNDDIIDAEIVSSDALVVEQIQENRPEASASSEKTSVILFSVLLGVSLALTLIMASGYFRFGLSGPVVTTLYVFLGLLAAFGTFGILRSKGSAETSDQYGWSVQLGGAAVALVVVPGIGIAAENLRPSSEYFDVRFKIENNHQPLEEDGELKLYMGSNLLRIEVNDGDALAQQVRSDWHNKPVRVDVQIDGWTRQSSEHVVLIDSDIVVIDVVRK